MRTFSTLAVALVVVAGCGSGGAENTAATSPVTSGTVQPDRDTGSTPQTSPTVDLGESGTVTEGAVTVTVAASPIKRGRAIEATVANGLDHTIFTNDAKSACTILVLQRSTGASASTHAGWVDVRGCTVRRRPITFAIGAGRSRHVTVDPASALFGVEVTRGTYRLAVAYRTVSAPDAADTDRVASEPFVLND